jgi:hypothetical protein
MTPTIGAPESRQTKKESLCAFSALSAFARNSCFFLSTPRRPDVRLIRDAWPELPLSTVHRDLLEQAERIGCGALDNSSIIRVFESL